VSWTVVADIAGTAATVAGIAAVGASEVPEPPSDGIGFVFLGVDPFVGIDLDDCRDGLSL
jgi:hypothetical protein